MKLKVTQPQSKYKTINFRNLANLILAGLRGGGAGGKGGRGLSDENCFSENVGLCPKKL